MTALVGQRFGLLTVQSRDDSPGITPGKDKWICQCDCGIARSLSAKSLLSAAMRSCGCQTARRRKQLTRDQQRFDLAEARKQLSAAQLSLTDAIHGLDAEEITAARLVFNEALKRVRDLKAWRALADLGRGRPLTEGAK
jgi:hypothetical protein